MSHMCASLAEGFSRLGQLPWKAYACLFMIGIGLNLITHLAAWILGG